MESVLSLKMLAVFALVLLVSGVNAGRVLTKCELKAHLEAAQFQVIPDNMTVDDLIARLVCKASSSDFKMDSVKLVTKNHQEDHKHQSSLEDSSHALPPVKPQVPPYGPPNGTHQGPLTQGPPQSASQVPPQGPSQVPPKGPPQGASQVPPQGPSQVPPKGPPQGASQVPPQGPPQGASQVPPQGPPQGSSQVPPKGPPQGASQVPPQGPPQGSSQVPPKGPPNRPRQGTPRTNKRFAPQEQQPSATEHLYGVFQLSDQEACSSGMGPSHNVCQMTCAAFIDNDIMDDIGCLKTLISSGKPKTKGQRPDNPHILNLEECRDVVPSEYFAECV